MSPPGPAVGRRDVAVHVIAGFLGSGKTTLVRRLVEHARASGHGVALVVNDMAEADVDGALLHAAHGEHDDVSVMGLAGGCVCCDLGEEMVGAVRAQIDRPGVDVLFIETTGLAALPQVLSAVRDALDAPGARRRGALGACVGLVDASRFLDQRAQWPAAAMHLEGADVILLNHTDAASADVLAQVRREVSALWPLAGLVETSFARVEPGALLGEHRVPAAPVAHVMDTTAGYTSSTFQIRKRVDLDRLEALLRRFPKTLVRLKGFVFVEADDMPRALQWSQKAARLSVEPFSGDIELGYLAVIGRRISWDRFLDGLERSLVRRTRLRPAARA